jgi:glyoxylase-like metal-dependent hydrolase (beta-lactamase superfamily II)
MTTFTRRGFATTMLAAPLMAALPSPSLARAPQGAVETPVPFARINVGRFVITFLSDGFIDFPFNLFTGMAADEVEQLSAAHFVARPTGVRRGFTVWLIRDGEQLILVAPGPAGTVSKTSGRLPAALAAVGVDPEMIDAVIVTHMHVDHIAGLVAGGRANFPNAEIYVDRREVAISPTRPRRPALRICSRAASQQRRSW